MADQVDPSASYESSGQDIFGEDVEQMEMQNECNGEKEGTEYLLIEDDSTSIRWSTGMVKLLLKMYADHQNLFISNAYSNKRIWQMIAEKMTNHGCKLTGEQCDLKWRNMKKTYRKTKERYDANGRNHWAFFADMDAIFSPNLECQPVSTASSFRANNNDDSSSASVLNNTELVIETSNSSIGSKGLQNESPNPIRWNAKMVTMLLSAYSKYCTQGGASNSKLWQHVALEMKKNGYSLSGEQCNTKWRGLKKCYLKVRFNSRVSRFKQKWPYFQEVDRIMSKIPVTTRTRSRQGTTTCNNRTQVVLNSVIEVEPPSSSGRQKTNRNIPEVEPQWFADFKAEKRHQHEELMQQRRQEEHNRQTFRENMLKLLTEVANKSREADAETMDTSVITVEKRTRYEERLQQKRVEQDNKQAFRETMLKLLTNVIHKD